MTHSDDVGIYAVLQIMQCCIEQPMIRSVIPLQRSFKNTHVWMWSFFHFYSLQSMERSRLCQNGGKRWGKTGRERMSFEWKIVQHQEFMFLCRMFPCRAAFQKGHFYQSGLHKPSQLPQNCCAEIHRQPLNTITFSNSLFSLCLFGRSLPQQRTNTPPHSSFPYKSKNQAWLQCLINPKCVWYFGFSVFFKSKVIPALVHFVIQDGGGEILDLCEGY